MAFCTHCGAQLPDNAASCEKCGFAVSPKFNSCNPVSELRYIIPIGRSGWAIAAGYLGLLSPIPFVGIRALVLGVVAVRSIKRHPGQMGLGRAWFGIVAGGLCTLFHLLCLARVFLV